MKLRQQWLQRNLGGGGNTGAQAVASAPVPAATPPVTTTNAEVVQAQQDMRRQALRKRGFGNASIYAGDTGGANQSPGPANSVARQVNAPALGARTLGG